jgi:hypothetical protein
MHTRRQLRQSHLENKLKIQFVGAKSEKKLRKKRGQKVRGEGYLYMGKGGCRRRINLVM